jgi:hypothetical protein
MHMGLKQIELPEKWAIKKSRICKSVLLGHPTVPSCAVIACVGDDHWEEDWHEVIVFNQLAKEASKEGAAWGESVLEFRLHHWCQLKSCLQAIAEGRADEWYYPVITSTE